MKKAIARCLSYGCLLPLLIPSVAAQTVESPETVQGEAVKVRATVDRRVELLTIVARLANFEEYTNNVLETYADGIDTHFGKHKGHPAVVFASALRKDHGLGYDAVMTMAVHLSQPPELVPRVTLTDDAIDGRWGTRQQAEEFVKLLQRFYKESDCESFFESQADFYASAEQRFQQLLDQVDFDWCRRFYGETLGGTFNVFIRLQTGGNYGPSVVLPNQERDIYAILGTTQADDEGLPLYGESRLPTIIHELSHSFINPLFFNDIDEFQPAGEKIFASAEKLRNLGYGNWESTVIESLVRAAVIRYRLEHEADHEVAFRRITTERNFGFLWMEEVVTLLGAYENSRKNYPTFRSMFPLIIGYFDDLSQRVERETKIFEQMSPHVTGMSPFANQSQEVNPNVRQLTLTFDRPMDTQALGSIGQGSGGEAHYPIVKVIGFDETGTALTVELRLKPDWDYEFRLTGSAFGTRDGYPLQTYTVKFKTRKPAT